MARLILTIALFAVGIAADAHAFGTIHGLGQSAEHEKITRIALAPFRLGPETMDEIAGKRGSFGAVGAPDHPARGLINKDYAHCDNGDFLATPGYPHGRAAAARKLASCRAWIFRQMRNAVLAAGGILDAKGRIRGSQIPTIVSCKYSGAPGRAKCNVLEALGLAFHAAQDFYSHTNWTDRAVPGATGLTNPPGLRHGGPAAWIDPRKRTGMPAGLISGCFEGIPESRHCKGRVRHAVLNKDTGTISVARRSARAGTTRRGKVDGNFARAVRAAIADTRTKWAYFQSTVIARYGIARGRRILCAIRNDKPDGC
jgi:hypothetical protein